MNKKKITAIIIWAIWIFLSWVIGIEKQILIKPLFSKIETDVKKLFEYTQKNHDKLDRNTFLFKI